MDLEAFDAIENVLKKVLTTDPGIKKVILTDRTGFTIAHASRSLEYLIEIDEVGAIASHIFCASEDLGQNLDLSALDFISLNFDEGTIRIAACGKGIICFYTEQEVRVLKLTLKNLENELKDLIDKYLKDPIGEAYKLNTLLSKGIPHIKD